MKKKKFRNTQNHKTPLSITPPTYLHLSIGRRLAVIAYETMLIIAIFFAATFLTLLFKAYLPLDNRSLMQATLIITLGCYFSWSWSLGRQTLAMKTWHVKLITQNHQAVQYPSLLHAFYRYIGILLPWIAVEIINHLQQEYRHNHNIPTRHYHMLMQLGWFVTALVFPWAWALFHPEKLSFHDALARTRLVYEPKTPN